MAGGAIQTGLNMNPVWIDNKARKFIHSLPGDLFPGLHILDDLKRLRPFADRIGRMAGLTELNIWNPCHTIPFGITMAESTVQMGYFLMMNVVEEDRLIDRFPREDRED
jgi:hypothetical protein